VVAGISELLGYGPCGLRRRAPQSRALLIDPLFEGGPGVGHEKPVEEVTTVHPERIHRPPCKECRLERSRVYGHCRLLDADLIVTACDHYLVSEHPAEEPERLTQRAAGVGVIELGPEERDDCVAPVKLLGASKHEVHEERKALGLPEERPHIAAVRGAEIERTKCLQLNHRGHR
jgi:hypothetical protein